MQQSTSQKSPQQGKARLMSHQSRLTLNRGITDVRNLEQPGSFQPSCLSRCSRFWSQAPFTATAYTKLVSLPCTTASVGARQTGEPLPVLFDPIGPASRLAAKRPVRLISCGAPGTPRTLPPKSKAQNSRHMAHSPRFPCGRSHCARVGGASQHVLPTSPFPKQADVPSHQVQ